MSIAFNIVNILLLTLILLIGAFVTGPKTDAPVSIGGTTSIGGETGGIGSIGGETSTGG